MTRCQYCHLVTGHLRGCPDDSHWRSNADKNGAWCNECREYRATSVTCQKCAESLCGSCMVEHKCEKEQPK